jgi:hypothetical protein
VGCPTHRYELPSAVALTLYGQGWARLPAGLSSLPTGCARQWLILVAHHQWDTVQGRLGRTPAVQLLIDGEVLLNPKTPVTVIRAQHLQVVS